MASKGSTFLAFRSIVKRSLTTCTPTRAFPRPQQTTFHPPYQSFQITSKATKGRKLPQNHFTSNSQPFVNEKKEGKPQKKVERKELKTKRKASLRQVAVEAQQSRGTSTPIKGQGRRKYVDPDVETKDVTAYCAAEQYNLYVARDILEKEGLRPDPFNTELFPQVLHVEKPASWFPGGKEGDMEGLDEQQGDIFVFPSGSVVGWNVSEKLGLKLVNKILKPAAERIHSLEFEDLEYIEDSTREHSKMVGDTIILGTKPSEQHQQEPGGSDAPSLSSADEMRSPEIDTTLAKIAFSSALARSTKLAVLENTLEDYMHTTKHIPYELARGAKPPVTRRLVLRRTGELLKLRANLNLYSELTDSLPDIFWDSPHSLGLESYYDMCSRVLDVDLRIQSLNSKMDYASEITAVLRGQMGEKHGHWLEWIIIWLIVTEVVFGVYHIVVEWHEWLDEDSEYNLAKEWYRRELGRASEREDRKREG